MVTPTRICGVLTPKLERAFKTRPTINRQARLPGSYIADLVSLGKAICLCGHCEYKFDFKGNGYKPRVLGLTHPRFGPQNPYVISGCDGCKNIAMCQLFLKD